MAAGRLAEALVQDLTRRYPDICADVHATVQEGLRDTENELLVVPTVNIQGARDLFQSCQQLHQQGVPYGNHGGRASDQTDANRT